MEKQQKQSSQKQRNKVYLKYEIQNINELYFKLEDSENGHQDNKINQKTNGSLFTLRNLPPNTCPSISPLQKPLNQFSLSQIPNIFSQNHYSNLKEREANLKQEQKYCQKTVKKQYITSNIDKKEKKEHENSQQSQKKDQITKKDTNLKKSLSSNNMTSISYEKYNIDEKYKQYQISNESKKNKKGLAYISLKVKNIVLQHSKLTYKQVSDLVLASCQHQISSLHPKDQQKEVKNIRRRVYDALNVLVSVDILARNNRQVIITQFTNFQGKRLTSQWEAIRYQEEQINRRKKVCQEKAKMLQQVINKYKSIIYLRKRNQEKINLSQTSNQQVNHQLKVYFPFIIIPRSISFEVEMLKDDISQTVIIRGRNIKLMSDVDIVGTLNIKNINVDISSMLNQVEKFKKDQTSINNQQDLLK